MNFFILLAMLGWMSLMVLSFVALLVTLFLMALQRGGKRAIPRSEVN